MSIDQTRIIPEQIREAREAAGLTDEQFAEQIGVSRGAVGHYETGMIAPRGDVFARIIDVTGQPASFFTTSRNRSARLRMPNWRSLKRMQRPDRLRIARRLEWALDIASYLERFIELPAVSLPSIDFDFENDDEEKIEGIAEIVRQHWGLAQEPVTDLPALLEYNGCILIEQDVRCEDMDAVSRWQGGRPFILYSREVESTSRTLFNLAHELGHVVLHSSVEVTSKNLDRVEKQANRFAGAFLLPRRQFTSEVARTSIDYFLVMKQRWRVAVAAMVYRCKDLGILNPAQVQYIWKQMAIRKIRKREPLDNAFKVSTPTILSSGIRMLIEHGVQSKSDIVGSLCLNSRDIEDICGLQRDELQAKVATLRLIK
ncbi:helix-turn-helix domain-containing protein [Rhizobium phaseoli]|uniref:helix-turn-helix domain-containing protein n=1 Tax=Rhizobium phaseoli TaxID=396 RepID=UPI0007F0ACBD|nr:XRE family transcriptional regulator [Rhizobium phaseoli]ANL28598.1 helix-turn-helix domain-containing protein [Rhizobium phaseoli]